MKKQSVRIIEESLIQIAGRYDEFAKASVLPYRSQTWPKNFFQLHFYSLVDIIWRTRKSLCSHIFIQASSRRSVSWCVLRKTASEKKSRTLHYFLFCSIEQSISSNWNHKQFIESNMKLSLSFVRDKEDKEAEALYVYMNFQSVLSCPLVCTWQTGQDYVHLNYLSFLICILCFHHVKQ